MTLRPGMPERGGFADLFQTIDRRLAALERTAHGTSVAAASDHGEESNESPSGEVKTREETSLAVSAHIRRLTVLAVTAWELSVTATGASPFNVQVRIGDGSTWQTSSLWTTASLPSGVYWIAPHFIATFTDPVPKPVITQIRYHWSSPGQITSFSSEWDLSVLAIGLPV